MSDDPPDSSKKRKAAMLYQIADDSKRVSIPKAMDLAGYSTKQTKDRTLQMQIRRQVDKNRKDAQRQAANPPPVPTAPPPIPHAAPARTTVSVAKLMEKKKAIPEMRLTTRQAQGVNKVKAEERHQYVEAVKYGTRKLAEQQQLPKKKRLSAETIANEINRDAKKQVITGKTIRNNLKKGIIGVTPQKRGNPGRIVLHAYKALCGAFETYVKISANTGKVDLSNKKLAAMLNECVNFAGNGEKRTGTKLLFRLRKDLALTLDLGKPNKVEDRRFKWTTHDNVNIYFNSLKEFFIVLGFAIENVGFERDEDGVVIGDIGEITFVDDAEEKIVNPDESGHLFDNCNGEKGGRPCTIWFDPYLSDAPKQVAHKSSYRLTGMYSVTMKRPLRPHFILPSDAREENMGIDGIEFFKDMKQIIFDRSVEPEEYDETSNAFPVTLSFNEKGSMTKEELDKYFHNSLLPQFPDRADEPGKRVAVLIDGGPGRTNLEMLAELRATGVYLFPSGPPNTTALLQIMDQLFGSFKTTFSNNFEKLFQYRLGLDEDDPENGKINRFDFGALVFGKQLSDRVTLEDAFNTAFDPKRIKAEWKKAGINPFTRNALKSDKIHHELVLDDNGNVDSRSDPKGAYLQELKLINDTSCSILDAFGYKGDIFRAKLPERNSNARAAQMTRPHTRERQDAIQNKRSQGGLFQRTGGAVLNGDDVFIANTREELQKELKVLKEKESKRSEQADRQRKAQEILNAKDTFTSADLRVLISWKLGKNCPSSCSTLAARRAKWNELKDKEAPPCDWTEEDDRLIVDLEKKIDNIGIEDTALARSRERLEEQAVAMVPTMNKATRKRLRASLDAYSDSDSDSD